MTQYNGIYKPLKDRIYSNSIKVQEICKNLFNRVNLNYFSYGRIYNDYVIVVATNCKWIEHFLTINYPFAKPMKNSFTSKITFFSLWENSLYSQVTHIAREYFDITNGITLFFDTEDYYEYFSFASPKSNHNAILFYLNNMDILESFSKYFLRTCL
jgi:hypothetical protein